MSRKRCLAHALSFVVACAGCAASSGPGAAPDTPAGDGWREVALEPSQGFLDRKARWLDACFEGGGRGKGGLHAQVCRVALQAPVNADVIAAACDKVDARKDTSDFAVASLLRMLWLDRGTHALDEATRARIERTVLGFKYWLDEPGKGRMCYWSENHQILYHSNELIAGLLFPDTGFPNAGITGRGHVDRARPRVDRWLRERATFGFSEWHSNVYFNEDVPALLNLADFADDPATRTRAAGVLDL
ncbi:MAG: hypothetical protein FJ087_21565, partial [Deltaproteobacteria bacterium]|nr:hypothetical protein [Deltaproteobacteria bacterium]